MPPMPYPTAEEIDAQQKAAPPPGAPAGAAPAGDPNAGDPIAEAAQTLAMFIDNLRQAGNPVANQAMMHLQKLVEALTSPEAAKGAAGAPKGTPEEMPAPPPTAQAGPPAPPGAVRQRQVPMGAAARGARPASEQAIVM